MSAPQTFTVAANQGSAAAFKAWGQALSNALQALGTLTKTADTGQIDWSTNPAVPAAGVSAGYEIYAFNGALQASAPIYFKVEYGTNTTSGRPQIWVTVGTGTDGAGTLTSMAGTNVSVTNRNGMLTNTTSQATADGCMVTGDADTLVIAMWTFNNGPVQAHGVFWCERVRDINGDATADGFICGWGTGGGTSTVLQNIYHHNQAPQLASTTASAMPLTPGTNVAPTTTIKDSTLYTLPVFTGWGPRLGAPSKFLVAHHTEDLGQGGTFTVTHYGASHSFQSPGLTFATNGQNVCPAIRTD